ncbi:helix-turn-helix domain-containing protein [Vagococcus carniphilus]|uniref:Helix-turn-helix domain-containing protein n=1 Tax=Vagococcus carniphilus TaxID=218144 RepID=A0AAW8U4U9_9ENTE|nr:helix-turn-helix domain-containing protein [Vagococcus carniphilus]MDT2831801.1 helix-turn-helix domain-containing protein [Vagococcus carniphilus]MDT2834119.1 helix-turn-helix domain-containing protein [Vagococcus carniphilus]MDT2840654.1 helix-turn-helix domain-containing protein [Vagococcus carniphilus]MDT2855311.1 helix-turn-helix domain-containing protein [Vagococcus carniphilus]
MSEDTGNLISQKRKEKKLTQDDLAKELHVTRQAVSNWERNVTVPDRPTIEKLSAVLGANLDQLVRKEQSNKIGDDQKMIDKEVEKIEMPINKYDTAIGLFYAVSLFVGMMVSLLLVVLKKTGNLANVGDCSGNRVTRFSYPRFNNSRYYYTSSKR